MPPQITCASALPGKMGKHENHIFHSNAVLVESAAAVGLCCMHSAQVCCLSERKIVICAVFDSVYICWDSKISHWYCPLTFTQAWRRTTPMFYTATNTVTDVVNIEHVGNDSRILGPVWCIQSIVLTVKGGSAVTRWYFSVFHVVLVKKHAAFTWKDAIFGFLFPQVVQKHTLGEVGK